MSDRSGLSRGDRNRNARLVRLRQLLPPENAIVGIDLADDKQAAVVTGHDSRVIARRQVRVRAWELGDLLDWAVERAERAVRLVIEHRGEYETEYCAPRKQGRAADPHCPSGSVVDRWQGSG
jgi:hypothetical protein